MGLQCQHLPLFGCVFSNLCSQDDGTHQLAPCQALGGTQQSVAILILRGG